MIQSPQTPKGKCKQCGTKVITEEEYFNKEGK